MEKDKGHELLMSDLKDIYEHAEDFQFHDFKNDLHATPKMVLRTRLLTMAQAVVDGKYDN